MSANERSPGVKELPSLPDELLRSGAWSERPAKVELCETHISWVYLTDRYAYKVKKPVKLEFLDFSTLERRKQACLEEVRLNRRLAPDIYLGVVPIVRVASGRLRVGGTGPVVDWAVKMHRLPEDRSLDRLIADHELQEAELQRLVNRLVCFYSSLPPLAMAAEKYRTSIERHILENQRELADRRHGLPPLLVERVHGAQIRFLHLASELIDNRVCDGRVVEGHGDLRPEHIYLSGEPVIIDCLEFSHELRRIDVLDEISFLAMECAMLGAPSIGRRIITQFSAISGDRPDMRLLAFYQSYRACVRSKVMSIRAQQLAGAAQEKAQRTALRYLSIADEFARQWSAPLLVVVSGLAGTGKSTVAAGLSEQLVLTPLQTDSIRRELSAGDESASDRYSPQQRAEVYAEMFRRGGELLERRQSVVLDGTFLQHSQIRSAQDLAAREGAKLLVVRCHCPASVAHERIRGRAGADSCLSEATPEVHDRQMLEMEAIPESVSHHEIETTRGWPEIWNDLRAYLRGELLGFPASGAVAPPVSFWSNLTAYAG